MSQDSLPSASSDSGGPGIIDTVSSWATPEGAENSTTVVNMVSDLTTRTTSALRAALALSVAGPVSAVTGAVTLANKATLGVGYLAVNKIAKIASDSSGKVAQFIGGNKA